MSNVKALEGQWYSDRSSHDVFCVIGIDELEGLIGVRDGYGDVDEFDFDEWESMDLVLCAPPSGWVTDDTDEDSDLDGPGTPWDRPGGRDAPQESGPRRHNR